MDYYLIFRSISRVQLLHHGVRLLGVPLLRIASIDVNSPRRIQIGGSLVLSGLGSQVLRLATIYGRSTEYPTEHANMMLHV